MIWKRVQRVLAEYCLTPLAMAAARKWVREMADPDNEALARLRAWMILRINGRERAAPPSPWQAGCPEILEGLRARPIWDASELPWLKPFEENASAIRDELLALRSGARRGEGLLPMIASRRRAVRPDPIRSRLPAAQDPEVGVEESDRIAGRRRRGLARCGRLERLLPQPARGVRT